MKKYIKISPKDNVAVALSDLKKGEEACGVVLAEDIVKGHKFCIRPVKNGENVIKYGEVIGHATRDISVGEHVHIQNLQTNLGGCLQYSYSGENPVAPHVCSERKISVYRRFDGNVGIRNEIWVIPTVGCVNGQAKEIVRRFNAAHTELCHVDGIFAYTHPYGCSQVGDDHERTKTLLQQLVKHPNAGGVLVLGLGCENNRPSVFRDTLGNFDPTRVEFLVAQDVSDEIEEGLCRLEKLYARCQSDERTEADISVLKVGLKCGGSDGLSGITANPLLGRFSDFLTSAGGTTVLTEVPEMFGAEQLLMARAENKQVFDKIVALINNFKNYYASNGQPCYENPSPGNKAGGISTLEDKSLGCTQKSGSSPVCGVALDGEQIVASGLNLLNGPGNDMVAVTNLAAAGCHLVLFTTGRGTPFGGIVPTVKISTNSELASKKRNWIDFDAGTIVDGDSFDDKLQRLVDLICSVASGEKTANERNNSREIALFKTGVTL